MLKGNEARLFLTIIIQHRWYATYEVLAWIYVNEEL